MVQEARFLSGEGVARNCPQARRGIVLVLVAVRGGVGEGSWRLMEVFAVYLLGYRAPLGTPNVCITRTHHRIDSEDWDLRIPYGMNIIFNYTLSGYHREIVHMYKAWRVSSTSIVNLKRHDKRHITLILCLYHSLGRFDIVMRRMKGEQLQSISYVYNSTLKYVTYVAPPPPR